MHEGEVQSGRTGSLDQDTALRMAADLLNNGHEIPTDTDGNAEQLGENGLVHLVSGFLQTARSDFRPLQMQCQRIVEQVCSACPELIQVTLGGRVDRDGNPIL